MKKTFQGLKMKTETLKKTQMGVRLEMDNLEKRSGDTDARIINKIHEIKQETAGVGDTIEYIDASDKVDATCRKNLTQNIQNSKKK